MWFYCLLVVRIYLHALYIIFLFVNNENNNFLKEIKHVVCASIACWKPWQSLLEFSSRWKPLTASWVSTDLLSNPPKRSPRFSPDYEGMENMFYFLTAGFGRDTSSLHCFLSSSISSVMFNFLMSSSTTLRQVFFALPTGLLHCTFHLQLHHSPTKYAILVPTFYVTKPSQSHFP